ncbi:MAG: glutamate synthase large subunit, partial [Candidatus Methanoplasma sp.]|nr:glutamate synthase large subunit [Candidatus Methanoplasma sp.]
EIGRSVPDIESKLAAFGYTKEEISKIIEPMMTQGREPVGSTGSDIPLAVLSDKPQRLFNYFRQSFAQVTNPPIDPIREELVMSVTGYIGHVRQSLLDRTPKNFNMIKVRHPVITNRELDLLKNLKYRGFKITEIPITFKAAEGAAGLENALLRICGEAEDAVDNGGSYILLSDRGIDKENAAIPSLLAVSAVHQHLLGKRKRIQTGIVLESGEPREVMHFALLFGYGANVINPYLVHALVEDLVKRDGMKIDPDSAERNFIKASEKGLMKVMSKMGISTIRSYIGAGLFEAVGLDERFVKEHFGNTTSNIGGIGLEEIADDAASVHTAAFDRPGDAQGGEGVYGYTKYGEKHSWSPAAVKALQRAARDNDAEAYMEFKDLADGGRFFIRDLMGSRKGTQIPLRETESAESIMKRFVGQGISFGAISKEAHETFAEAMNMIGGQSNTGEGGEDPSRAVRTKDGRDIRSRVKQVASGRFGVTVGYLVSADEIQIKIAQGAKPGEGGQLAGDKVDKEIAATRHTLPGVTLISPPPHHDIYSIEDLKQLILDMRCVNPAAKINVKLVAESGVGTVAAGVVKAGADKILISGSDGGTGASPLSSIRYAGMPWELGLAEAQQTLMIDGLRDRVRLQVDGQMKTGRDVVTAALLGAEEYGFATAPMVAMGCVMCRKCQSNTCPAGIATQDPAKRERFAGRAEHIVNYMRFIAEDVRERMSEMGVRSVDELVGRSDLIVRADPGGRRSGSIDIGRIVEMPAEGPRTCTKGQPDTLGDVLDRKMIRDAGLSLETGGKVNLEYTISNVDRSVGAMLSGELVRRGKKLRDGTVNISFRGTAGQSFGAFITEGMTFRLTGQANDYVGKGLSGGRIAIFHEGEPPRQNVIAGNTLLYGATGGEVYIAGKVGERFCVRNSGATAVAEGAGDHCCEYMTGGRVVILGEVGRNFAAGMSAGIAYVLNDNGNFDRQCNMDMVELLLVESESDRSELRSMLESHLRYTGSRKAAEILGDWEQNAGRFLKVLPIGYKKLLETKGADAIH